MHGADARAQALQRAGVEPPGRRVEQPDLAFGRPQRRAEHAQQRGLARARGADDRHALARPRGQRHAGERTLAVRVDHADGVDREAHAQRPSFLPAAT
ncbi:hypothetical protein M2165_003153 [Variovorax sp. TBS-050B]|nr:hypothetical protein [Variovorax sp. TBS-050B]